MQPKYKNSRKIHSHRGGSDKFLFMGISERIVYSNNTNNLGDLKERCIQGISLLSLNNVYGIYHIETFLRASQK